MSTVPKPPQSHSSLYDEDGPPDTPPDHSLCHSTLLEEPCSALPHHTARYVKTSPGTHQERKPQPAWKTVSSLAQTIFQTNHLLFQSTNPVTARLTTQCPCTEPGLTPSLLLLGGTHLIHLSKPVPHRAAHAPSHSDHCPRSPRGVAPFIHLSSWVDIRLPIFSLRLISLSFVCVNSSCEFKQPWRRHHLTLPLCFPQSEAQLCA